MDIMFTVKCEFLSSVDVLAITVYACVCRREGVCVCVCGLKIAQWPFMLFMNFTRASHEDRVGAQQHLAD